MNGTLVKDMKEIKKDGKRLAKNVYHEVKDTGEDILDATLEKGKEVLDNTKEICDCFLETGSEKETKEV